MREDWTAALIAAGLRPDSPTVWLVEGLFYYLGRNAGDSVLKRLSAVSAPGSRLALDIPHERFLAEPAKARFLDYMAERGSPFLGAVQEPVRWLADYGWHIWHVVGQRL